MSNAPRLVTAEELERLPGDDNRYELIRGRVVCMTPTGFRHGRIVMRLSTAIDAHIRQRAIQAFVVADVGFKLESDPDTVRAPDIAVIGWERLPVPEPKGFPSGPPDLAVEVLSLDDRARDVQEKVDEYLARGVRLVVVIDPDERAARVFRPSSAPVTLAGDDVLDLDPAVPAFRCTLREIFE